MTTQLSLAQIVAIAGAGLLAAQGTPLAAGGDAARETTDPQKDLKEAGKKLDQIEKHLAEWGHASISSFVLVPHRTNFFDLNYNRPTEEYVAAIRSNLQGTAAFLEQREVATEIKGRFANALAGVNVAAPSAAPTAAEEAAARRQEQLADIAHQIQMAQLQRDLARITNATDGWQTNLVALPSLTNPPPAGATGPTNREPALPTTTGSYPSGPLDTTNGFAAAGKLLSGASGLQLSETAILKLAATAKETERVLNFMSHPVDLPGNKQAFFAIGQISVMPGWRTKRDYVCEVSARFTYVSRERAFLHAVQQQNPLGYQRVIERLRAQNHQHPRVRAEDELATLRGNLKAQRDLPPALSRLVDSLDLESLGEFQQQLQLQSSQLRAQVEPQVSELTALERELSGEYRGFVYANDELAAVAGWNDHSLALVSAFPLVESQVFDLQNSYRSQTSFLLNLAALYLQAGYKIEGEVLYKFVKRLEKDIATRTSLPTVIPGVDSSTLTYRFDPEASAMLDPTGKKPKAGNQLLPSSIPVLVIAVAEKRDIERWEQLAVEIETRWIPRANTPWIKVPFEWVAYGRQRDTLASHKHGLNLADAFDRARELLPSLLNTNTLLDKRQSYEELRRRLAVLEQVGFGRTTRTDLPGREPQITGVVADPKNPATGRSAKFAIHGFYLTNNVQLTLGNIPLTVLPQESSDKILVAKFGGPGDVPLLAGKHDLEVRTLRGTARYPDAVTVISPEDQEPACANRPPIQIERILPERGLVNGRTVFIATGGAHTDFLGKTWNDPVTKVIVGGREAENVQVLGSRVLRFEVGPWSDGLPYINATTRADVAVFSACAADILPEAVYFDVKIPTAKKAPEPPDPLEQKMELLKQLQKVGGDDARFSGSLRLEVGTSNAPAAGASSTVINVQTGQNTNTGGDKR